MWIPTSNWQAASSFQQQVPPPAAGPSDPPLVCAPINVQWLPYVLGALQQLTQPAAWLTPSEAVLLNVLADATDLIAQVGDAGPCSTPPITDLIWVINSNDTVSQFHSDGSIAGPVLSHDLSNPRGAIAFGGDRVWLPNLASNLISWWRPDGTVAAPGWLDAFGGDMEGVADSFNTGIWLCEFGPSQIRRINYNGQEIPPVLTGNGLDKPFSVLFWFGAADLLNVNSTVRGAAVDSVSKWFSDGSSAGSVLTDPSLFQCWGIGANLNDPDGRFWVVNHGRNSVSVFNFDYSLFAVISGGGLSGPTGVAGVGVDEMWIANDGPSTISRYHVDTTSAGADLTGNGMSGPVAIAVIV